MGMDWFTVAQLIIAVGLPATERIIQNLENKTPVTAEEYAKVRADADQTGQDRMRKLLVQAGYTLDDPKAKALLELTAGPPSVVATQ